MMKSRKQIFISPLSSSGRAIYFSTLRQMTDIVTLAAEIIIPDFLFFTCFSILLSYWAVVYFTAIGKLNYNRAVYWVCFTGNFLYTSCGLILFVLLYQGIVLRGIVAQVLCYTVAFFSFCISVSFCFLGYKLFLICKRLQAGRKSEIFGKVVFVSVSCFVCFLYKGVYVCLIPTFSHGDVYRLGTYLLIGEIIPSLFMVASFNYFPKKWQESFSHLADLINFPLLGRAYGTMSNPRQNTEANINKEGPDATSPAVVAVSTPRQDPEKQGLLSNDEVSS